MKVMRETEYDWELVDKSCIMIDVQKLNNDQTITATFRARKAHQILPGDLITIEWELTQVKGRG